ncbi:MAG: acetylglutamate kinase [Bryobacteraceae bacterium]
MRILVKIGGTLLDDARLRGGLASQLAELARRHRLAVVHGGGKQVTQFLEQRGIQSRFVSGLRVSDEAVVDAVTKVIAGGVNKQLVAALLSAGQPAVGLSGVDGLLTHAAPLDPALGFVGRPVRTDARLLNLLADAGYLPVLACVAADERGVIYNVNADRMAVSAAIAWRAEQLLFLTDVPGVKDEHGEIARYLTPAGSAALIRSCVAHGGMQAKLEAAAQALEAGIEEIAIASGREPGICARLVAGEPAGTRLSPGALSGQGTRA